MASRAALFRALLASPLLVSAAACFSGESSPIGAAAPTLITVEPEAFLGDTVCGSHEGAMRAYVATITDISVDPPFRLASSRPVPCQLAVSFAYVVPGHGYVASIDAYDRDDLVPLGGAESGSSVMLDPQSGERVAPTWTTACGHPEGVETIAHAFRDMTIRGCSALERLEPAGETHISIDLSHALFGLGCGDAAGQVSRFEIVPREASLERKTIDCGEPVVFDVAPNRVYAFDVSAFEAGATEPRWAGRCEAESRAGTTLPAQCTPLSSRGTIRLRIEELLKEHGHGCSVEDVESYDVVLGDAVVVRGAPCANDAIIGPLDPGSYELAVVALGRKDGKLGPKLTAHCSTVTLAAGQQVETSCAP